MTKSLKNSLICLILIVISNLSLKSAPVSQEKAKEVVLKFISSKISNSSNLKLNQVYPENKFKSNSISSDNQSNDFYIYNINKSFVIVSADDKATPILAYSTESNFNFDKMPTQLKWWFDEIKSSILKIKSDNNLLVNSEWDKILNKDKSNSIEEVNSVTPLLQTKWNQAPFYNDKCPLDNQLGQRAVTGCVATAMAQVMKFWNYPNKGTSFHQYNHSYFGTLNANFSNTKYEWTLMPSRVTSSNEAVATLMLHCGIAVDMDYSVESSGSEGASLVAPALINYFGYSSNTKAIDRDKYSYQNWTDLLKAELTASRPIYYQGIGSGGGHAFVLDGFDNSGLFHVNWGWDGQSDGYFSLNTLNPDALGTGGGDGGFNSNQTAVIGVEAPAPKGSKLTIDEALSVIPTPIKFAEPFYLKTNIVNSGTSEFKGILSAALFTVEGVFVSYIDSLVEKGLAPGFNYGANGITFASNGIAAAAPGDYLVAVFQKEDGGNWKIIEDGNAKNVIAVTIEGPYNTIALFAEMVPSESNILQNKALTIKTDFANLSNADFAGEITLDLYKLDGTWIKEIASDTSIALDAVSHFTNGITFQIAGLNVEAGDYLIAAWSKSNDETDYTLVSANTFKNPISIKVSSAPMAADALEPNNTKTTGTVINIVLNSNDVYSAPVFKDNLNIHVSKDVDYFSIKVPSDKTYDYFVKAIVYDFYYPNAAKTYALDASISYELNGVYADTVFDDVTPEIKLKADDILNYKVSPLFQGLLGTYAVSFQMMRKIKTTDVEEELLINNLSPNPAKDFINFSNKFNDNKLIIIDSKGLFVKSIDIKLNESQVRIEIGELSNGVYFLKSNNGSVLEKFVVSK